MTIMLDRLLDFLLNRPSGTSKVLALARFVATEIPSSVDGNTFFFQDELFSIKHNRFYQDTSISIRIHDCDQLVFNFENRKVTQFRPGKWQGYLANELLLKAKNKQTDEFSPIDDSRLFRS